jgi:hypothetical protein
MQAGLAELPEEEIEKIIDEVDKDGNGEIDYEEFCEMLLKSKLVTAHRAIYPAPPFPPKPT